MAETTFTIGADVSCSDGICGEVTRVVVDPIAQTVTHLMVEPKHRSGLGRLVPVDLVDASTGELRLRCTTPEFDELDAAEETRFLPGTSGYMGYGPGQSLLWPLYGVSAGNVSESVTYDRLPLGEVAVRRGEQVHATDGTIGRVQGLVIDPSDRHVTHVLLQEGHLWGRKQVAIPIRTVVGIDDGIHLSIAKQQVEDLPAVNVDQPSG